MGSDRLGRILAALVACVALAMPVVARADATPVERETARSLLKDGDQKFAAHDFEGARKAYDAAHAIMKVPTTGLSLARTQIALGQLVEAHDVLVQVARLVSAGEPAVFAKARAEAKQLAATLEPRIASLAIQVEGPPGGADFAVKIDDLALSGAAFGAPTKVNPGAHVVGVCARGYDAGTQNVTLKEGEKGSVTLKLTPNPSATCGGGGASARPSEVGRLDVTAEKVGKVHVDDDLKGETPLHLEGISPGVHKVRITYDDGAEQQKTAYVTEGMSTRTRFERSSFMSGETAARFREGFHMGAAVGFASRVAGDPFMPAGGTASFVANYGLSPTVDLRASFRVTAGPFALGDVNGGVTLVEVPVGVRVNIGSVYTMGFAVSVGAMFASPVSCAGGGGMTCTATVPPTYVLGPEISLATLRLGSRRQFEIELLQGGSFAPAYATRVVYSGGSGSSSGRAFYLQSLSLTYLFL